MTASGIGTAVAVEYAKMRRLRLGLVTGVMALATTLFSSTQLFSREYASRINDGAHWGQLLMGYGMVKALMTPLLVAVLASRQVDIEHQGNGWTRSAVVGTPPGRLCLVKGLALVPAVVGVTVAEMASMVAISWAVGARTAIPWGPWLWYAGACVVVSLVLLVAHLWLACRVEGQLVGLGLGVIGGFVGVFSMLMPPWVAHMTPWGYFAVALPFTMGAGSGPGEVRIEQVTPGWIPCLVMAAVAAGVLALLVRRLDQEGV